MLGCGVSTLYAQDSKLATGGTASGNGGTVSYSVGQIVYTRSIGTNGVSVLAGVQQPYEISVMTGVEKNLNNSIGLSVYPNPTADYLVLSFDGVVKTQYCARLYDTHGRLIRKKKIADNKTKIAMKDLGSASYFLKVTQDNKQVKTFRIIKK